MRPYRWIRLLALCACVAAASGCYTAADACEDFIDAVAECEGAPDDHYNQAWCDANADTGCDDRRYYQCLENEIECNNGVASTHPTLCEIKADLSCPG